MSKAVSTKLETRVVRAAEAALQRNNFVTPIDVLIGVGWLPASSVDRWRQGRVDYLESVVTASLGKISTAMKIFRRWAVDNELRPSETAYVARTRERSKLRFSKSGKADIEAAYCTHWVSPVLSDAKRKRLAEQQDKAPDLVVVQATKSWTCAGCATEGGSGMMLLMQDAGPSCLTCAQLDHLVYLPAGDARLTRRAKKASELTAIVVRYSKSRHRYERQGILVEQEALDLTDHSQTSGSGDLA